MFKFFFAAAALVAAVSAQLSINTPTNVVECEPTLLSWSGGTGPFFLSIQPGNDPSGASLVNFGSQTGTSLTWNTSIAGGTSVSLQLRDSTGAIAQSAVFTVNPGSDSCLSGSASSTGSSGAGSSTGSSTTDASTTGASTTGASTTGASTTGGSSGSKTSSGSASTTGSGTTTSSTGGATSGAKNTIVPVGVAALVGAVIAAVMA